MNTIEINGKEYTLAYNIGAQKKLMERTGKNPFDGSIFEDMNPIIFSELIFCMVQEEIKMEEIDSISVKDMEKLEAAFSGIMQESESEKK